MHEGHRKRMLDRLAQSGVFCDHELLEILLYNAVPRKNTNELAHALLSAFGSVRGIFEAPMSQLMTVPGVGEGVAAYLHCIAVFYKKLPEAKPETETFAYNVHEFSGFLGARMRPYTEEVVEVYCVDGHSRVRFCRRYGSGKKNAAYVPSEELTALFAEHRPAGIVLAHNHPVGGSAPSRADDEFTARAELLCSVNNIRLCDHLIVSQEDIYSYFTSGRLECLRAKFNFNAIARKEGLL